MAGLAPCPLPDGSLLGRYQADGSYADCYAALVSGTVTLERYIAAFYNSPAFRLERWLLGAVLGRGADAGDVDRLARGVTTRFAAWSVEGRDQDQILLCDFQGKTRSWLKVEPAGEGTRLLFGSAVVPAQTWLDRVLFNALLGFHRIYSRVLLASAAKAFRV